MPEITFPCIEFKQRETHESPSFLLFAATAGKVLEFAAIQRRQDNNQGTQRKLSKARIAAIKRFFTKDSRNTIPTAIVITLNFELEALTAITGVPDEFPFLKQLRLQLPEQATDEQKPGLVIDGQHRLVGISKYSPDCMVPVVALGNVDDMEKAFQFLVINNKAAKVPSDLIKTLALDYQEAELATRLESARVTLHDNLRFISIIDVDEESPFRGIINLVSAAGDQGNRIVPPAAIESSIAAIQQKKIRELDDDDALCAVFYSIWKPIRQSWPELWVAGSRLMTKVGVFCMTSYATDIIVSRFDYGDLDITDPEAVEAVVLQILAMQSTEFWTAEWKQGSYDTKVGRDLVVRSLAQVARNLRTTQPWQEGLEIISV